MASLAEWEVSNHDTNRESTRDAGAAAGGADCASAVRPDHGDGGGEPIGSQPQDLLQWERRALQALVASQREKPGGRPPVPHNPAQEALQQQSAQLQAQVQVLEQTLTIRQQLAELSRSKKKLLSHHDDREPTSPPA